MKLKVIIDNSANPRKPALHAEHGLSILFETGSGRYLFDTGATGRAMENLTALGVDPLSVRAVILSHGHYDHGGGLRAFLQKNGEAGVYCARGARDVHVVRPFPLLTRPVGLDTRLLREFGGRFVEIGEPMELFEGIHVIPNIGGPHERPADSRLFYIRKGRKLVPDDFSHELMVVVRESDGLTVLTGCSHSGILNILDRITEDFPGERIKAVVGGFHMMNPLTRKLLGDADAVSGTGRTLAGTKNLGKIYTGHCTGTAAYALLKEELGERIEGLCAGKDFQT